jgi:hypothetical protein
VNLTDVEEKLRRVRRSVRRVDMEGGNELVC